MNTIELSLHIPDDHASDRIDRALSQLLADYSRAQIQNWIKAKQVQVNQCTVTKTRHPVYPGDLIEITATLPSADSAEAEPIDLDIIHEDQYLMIINKPCGLVVHPGAGNAKGTLVNALLHHDNNLSSLPRAGLIHRLDKDTTGLLVVARQAQSYQKLITAMQERQIKRHYLAAVNGIVISGDTIEAPIGRHATARTKMAVQTQGKPAITHYRVKKKFRAHSLLDVQLETGRTHQIRVHLTHIGYPLIGDKTYKKQKALEAKISNSLREHINTVDRQALHAASLSLSHPVTGEAMSFESPLPQDFCDLIDALTLDLNQPEG